MVLRSMYVIREGSPKSSDCSVRICVAATISTALPLYNLHEKAIHCSVVVLISWPSSRFGCDKLSADASAGGTADQTLWAQHHITLLLLFHHTPDNPHYASSSTPLRAFRTCTPLCFIHSLRSSSFLEAAPYSHVMVRGRQHSPHLLPHCDIS